MNEKMNQFKQLIIKGIKFCFTGGINTLIDFVVYNLLIWVGMNPYFSKGCGYLLGMVNSFLMNKKWTFRTENGQTKSELVRFIITNAVMLGISFGLLFVFINYLHLNEFWANIGATGVVMVLNFTVSNFWVFRRK